MKGLVYDGEKAVLRDDLEVRAPGPTEVKVRVVACGLCHSDLSVIDGTIPWPTPVVLGHEGAGIVEEVGAAVRNVAPGDHVVLHILTNCGTCKWCSIGKPVRCRATMANADQPFVRDGAPVWSFSGASFLAEHTLVGATQCVKIDDDIDLGVACLVGCAVLTGVQSARSGAALRAAIGRSVLDDRVGESPV